jgi:hypothetical protein
VVHEALGDPIFLTQEIARIFWPGPFLRVAEFNHLVAHGADIPVLKDTAIPGGDIADNDRLFLIR